MTRTMIDDDDDNLIIIINNNNNNNNNFIKVSILSSKAWVHYLGRL